MAQAQQTPLRPSIHALLDQAEYCFHHYDWTTALQAYGNVLAHPLSPSIISAAQVWTNIGIVRCHLGEYARAAEAFDQAIGCDAALAIAWYQQGMALFMLGDFGKAERRYIHCLARLPPGGDPQRRQIDYRLDGGLQYTLSATRVEWNVRICRLRAESLALGVHADKSAAWWCLSRLPAGVIFEPARRARTEAVSTRVTPTEHTGTKMKVRSEGDDANYEATDGTKTTQRSNHEATEGTKTRDQASSPANSPPAPSPSHPSRRSSRRITLFPSFAPFTP